MSGEVHCLPVLVGGALLALLPARPIWNAVRPQARERPAALCHGAATHRSHTHTRNAQPGGSSVVVTVRGPSSRCQRCGQRGRTTTGWVMATRASGQSAANATKSFQRAVQTLVRRCTRMLLCFHGSPCGHTGPRPCQRSIAVLTQRALLTSRCITVRPSCCTPSYRARRAGDKACRCA